MLQEFSTKNKIFLTVIFLKFILLRTIRVDMSTKRLPECTFRKRWKIFQWEPPKIESNSRAILLVGKGTLDFQCSS